MDVYINVSMHTTTFAVEPLEGQKYRRLCSVAGYHVQYCNVNGNADRPRQRAVAYLPLMLADMHVPQDAVVSWHGSTGGKKVTNATKAAQARTKLLL